MLVPGFLVTDQIEIIEITAFPIGGCLGQSWGFAVFVIGAYVGVVLTSASATSLELTQVSSLALLAGAIIGGLILITLSFEFLALFSAIVNAQMLSIDRGLGATLCHCQHHCSVWPDACAELQLPSP